MKASFIVSVPIKDKHGHVIGRKQVVKYEGLLAQAHEDGLKSIATQLVQAPVSGNGDVAIVRAVVSTCRGTFEGIGDASPSNVNVRVTAHLLRVAETRAKARALRDAVNIGMVSLEELEDGDELEQGPSLFTPPASTAAKSTSSPTNGASLVEAAEDLMTAAQRRLLFRIAAERGVPTDEIQKWLENHWGLKGLDTISKYEASRLIEKLKANGHGGGGS